MGFETTHTSCIIPITSSPETHTEIAKMGSHSIESLLSELDNIPLDPHYALKEKFSADPSPSKVILGSGIYHNGNGKPWVLPAVKDVCRYLI